MIKVFLRGFWVVVLIILQFFIEKNFVFKFFPDLFIYPLIIFDSNNFFYLFFGFLSGLLLDLLNFSFGIYSSSILVLCFLNINIARKKKDEDLEEGFFDLYFFRVFLIFFVYYYYLKVIGSLDFDFFGFLKSELFIKFLTTTFLFVFLKFFKRFFGKE